MINKALRTRNDLVEMYIASLEENQIPWRQTWNGRSKPYNGVSNNAYHGVNLLMLTYVAHQRGYKDPRWVTFNQAVKNKWSVQKGAKGVPIEYWMPYDKDSKTFYTWVKYNALTDEEKAKCEPRCKTSYVFNAECIKGIPELELESGVEIDSSPFIDNLIDKMGVKYVEEGTSAFYNPKNDCVTIPEKNTFKSVYGYNSTRLHELCHATGHQSRLNRSLTSMQGFGSESYAKEELRAEISSSFIGNDIGLPVSDENLENHKAYIQSWISILKEKPEELFKAITSAESIANYCLEVGEWERFREQSITQETVNEQGQSKDTILVQFVEPFPDFNGKESYGKQSIIMTEDGRYFYKEEGYSNCCEDKELTKEEALELYRSHEETVLYEGSSLVLNEDWYEETMNELNREQGQEL